MVRRSVFVVLLAVLLLPLVATADEQIPLKSVSDLKGNWSGSAGLGPFGSSATLTVQYTIKGDGTFTGVAKPRSRSEEHTSELQSQSNLVCRLLLEKKKKN